MRLKISLLFITLLFIVFTNCSHAESNDDQGNKPNILFIFSDDQTADSVGAYAQNPFVKTPNIDRLAEQGVRFTRAFNQGSFAPAVCVASRTMLNTGSSVWNAARYTSKKKFAPGEKNMPRVGEQYHIEEAKPEAYWSQYLKRAGYETYFSGKWHVQVPAQEVFDHTRNVRGGMPWQHPSRYERTFVEGEQDCWSPTDPELGGFWKGGKHWSEVLADDGVDFIKKAASKEDPFFIYLAFNAPHDPRQSPQEYIDMYSIEDIQEPENFLPEYPYAEYTGAGRGLRDEKLAPFPRTAYAVKKNRQEYFALVSHMDTQIGRILDALENSGQADNTYIFFTSDHGLALGDHGFMGKQNMYESSIRVPLIMSGPGLNGNQENDALVYLQDIMATSLDIAGIEIPSHVEFHSLLPLATGQLQKSIYQGIYGCYFSVQRMIRTEDYKMIIYPAANRVRLYDLKKDPNEMNDLAVEKEQHAALMQQLLELLICEQKKLKDPIDVRPAFEAFVNGVPAPSLSDETKHQPT